MPVKGGEVWADDTGPVGPGTADDGHRRDAVVLIHPGWGDARIWDQVVARLADRRRIVRYDGRGYGSSPPPTVPFTQLGDLAAVLDRLMIPRAVLVGHSGARAKRYAWRSMTQAGYLPSSCWHRGARLSVAAR